jgi:enoyl-CoA hydratase/carnithine racemase
VAPDALRSTTQQLAATIIANAPLSVRAAKRTVLLAAGELYGRLYDQADEIWEPVYTSEDAQEGPRAFSERRTPEWKGR